MVFFEVETMWAGLAAAEWVGAWPWGRVRGVTEAGLEGVCCLRAASGRLRDPSLPGTCDRIPQFAVMSLTQRAPQVSELGEPASCLPGCVWNATPRSLSPLERNIGFWTQA